MRKALAILGIAVLGALGAVGPAAAAPAHPPVASISKTCSAAAEEDFGDKTARTPGGTKCLGPEEFCSHAPGYAAAYRRAGFKCEPDGRLEER
jgi:hypothetical protein